MRWRIFGEHHLEYSESAEAADLLGQLGHVHRSASSPGLSEVWIRSCRRDSGSGDPVVRLPLLWPFVVARAADGNRSTLPRLRRRRYVDQRRGRARTSVRVPAVPLLREAVDHPKIGSGVERGVVIAADASMMMSASARPSGLAGLSRLRSSCAMMLMRCSASCFASRATRRRSRIRNKGGLGILSSRRIRGWPMRGHGRSGKIANKSRSITSA